ncbi:hypothetical protein D3C78_588530 [compost metagenome]
MGDVAKLAAQVGDVQLAQVEVVQQYLAFFRVMEAHQQAAQGAFARAAAADDANPLTRLYGHVHILQCRAGLCRVAEADMAEGQAALERGVLQGLLFGLAFLRQGHQGIGAAHRQLRLLIAGDQPCNLAERCQNPATEHVTGYQSADTEVASDDAVHPGDDGGHAAELLDEQRAVAGQRRQVAGVGVEAGHGAIGVFPLVLALALGTAGLEGFQAAEGFDQQCLAYRTEAEAFLHGVAQACLNEQGKAHRQREGDQWDQYQPAAQQADHQ